MHACLSYISNELHVFFPVHIHVHTCTMYIDFYDCSLPSALDTKSLPRCPQVTGMGACMFPTAGEDQGEALGYLLSDITEEVTGVLRLSYYNGAKCSNSGRSHVVHILFQCEKGSGVVSGMYMYNVCTCS